MENNLMGVRKGAWTKEEDILLRDCIHKYGEGKWHLVPPRAGLNRCRKSCRLRWLNYLRPNLNRGFFSEDEVDLIVRLHMLLGNRWSLIAGRLPGRTANDVKNFWNTHISKKPPATGESSRRGRKTITESNIIRPRPRTFSNTKPPAWSSKLTTSNSSSSSITTKPPTANDDEPAKSQAPSSSPSLHDPTTSDEPRATLQEDLDECIRWWGDLLEMTENGGQTTPFLFSDDVPTVLPEGFAGGGRISSADQEGVCGSLSLDGDDDMVWNLEQFIDQ